MDKERNSINYMYSEETLLAKVESREIIKKFAVYKNVKINFNITRLKGEFFN